MKDLNWDDARIWEEKANEDKDDGPKWSWDCSFKLDFDGPLLSISSRFYPPHKNGGDWWEGTVSAYLLEKKLFEKKFKCDTLDDLRKQVENFVNTYTHKIRILLTHEAH